MVPKSDATEALIRGAISGTHLFAALFEAQLAHVVAVMFEMRVDVGQTVMMQGDMGDNFYVIESGTFDVLVKQRGAILR